MSESFGSGEWDDRKVRHVFIRKVSYGPGGAVGMGWGGGGVGKARRY